MRRAPWLAPRVPRVLGLAWARDPRETVAHARIPCAAAVMTSSA